MRIAILCASLALAGCATPKRAAKDDLDDHEITGAAPAPAPAAAPATAAAADPPKEGEPQLVHQGPTLRLGWAAARARYDLKGAKCYADAAPETVIGAPSQRNEMMMGRAKVVTYGYRFDEGTLIIRCRNDHVEAVKVLKH